jgi:pyruvate formate lyase activating enzyme
VFQEAHALGLTTCLDTTGQGTKEHNWNKVLPHTDLVLFCVKHLDPAKYYGLTGLHQPGALAFAKELKDRNIPFWLRYVLIPGYTDAPEDIQKLIDFAKEQPSMRGIELLPYHTLGKHKWEALGLKYPLEGVKSPSNKEVHKVIQKMEAAGLRVNCDVKNAVRVEDTHHLVLPHS